MGYPRISISLSAESKNRQRHPCLGCHRRANNNLAMPCTKVYWWEKIAFSDYCYSNGRKQGGARYELQELKAANPSAVVRWPQCCGTARDWVRRKGHGLATFAVRLKLMWAICDHRAMACCQL